MDTVDDLVPAQPSIWDRIAGFLTQQAPVERRSAPEPGTPPQPTVIDQFVTGAARGMWDLPRKMIEGSQAHYETGNYDPSVPVEAALTAMTGGMPMAVRGAAGAAGGKLVQPSIRAYHGSPHDFDKFDINKIGTGEGAQAYGHGLYFAENEGVARSYRDTLAKRAGLQTYVDGQPAKDLDQTTWEVADDLAANRWTTDQYVHEQTKRRNAAIDAALRAGNKERADTLRDVLAGEIEAALALRGKTISGSRKGRMYEVNIDARPEQFLDWDKPLAQQPQVLEAIKEAIPAPGFWARQMQDMPVIRHERATNPESTGGQAYGAVGRYLGGDRIVSRVRYPGDARASAALRDAGIPGIKYLDQGSRAAGEGSHNYVVFDDKLIDIVKKYGLGGVSLLPPAAAAYLQQHLVPVEGDPFGNGT